MIIRKQKQLQSTKANTIEVVFSDHDITNLISDHLYIWIFQDFFFFVLQNMF